MSNENKESLSSVRHKKNRISLQQQFPSFSEYSLCHDEIDAQLAEELMGYNSSTDSEVEAVPIPLLTPPASPLPIKSEESVVEIYEWPSNLAVDNALTAASNLIPLSLEEMEEIDECKEPFVTFVTPRFRALKFDEECV